MFNRETIADTFISLVRWDKDENPQATQNPMGDLLTGSSGLTFNSQSPLLTINNLTHICPLFSGFTYSAWSAVTTYTKSSPLVTSGGNYYQSIVDSNLNHAVSDTAYWRQTTPFNEWLRKRIIAAISECVNDWFNLKFENKTAHNLIRANQVLDLPGYKEQGVGDTGRYCGFYITPYPKTGVVVKIDRVCVKMYDSENVTVTLYKNGVATANTLSFTGTGHPHPQWKTAGWELEKGNYYYLAYDRNTLTNAEPVNGLAGMIQNWGYPVFPGTHRPYAEVSGFSIDDLDGDVYGVRTSSNNYGLNISLSAKCDYTEFLVDQSYLFAAPIAKKVGISLLSEFLANAEGNINRLQLNADQKAEIFLRVNGDSKMKLPGLVHEYSQTLNAIQFDMPGLQGDCLPCSKKTIKYGKI